LPGGGVCAGNSRVTMFATKMALRTWLKLNPGRTSFKTTPCPALSFRCHLRTFLSLIPLRVFLSRKRPLLTFALTFLLHLVLSTCTTHTYPSAFSPATVYTLSRYVFTRSLIFFPKHIQLFVPDVSRPGPSCALHIGSLARLGQNFQSHIDPSRVYTSKQAIQY
jgi:hypothetical protein